MSSEIEAAGSLAEAAIVAHTFDGETANIHDPSHGECLNCGAVLLGSHCHTCGQSAHIHRSFSAFWHDILHGVLHFDGKFWNTLPLLAWQPGQLTRRYIHGERAKFISPMAIFLFAIFMMFAVFSYVGYPNFSDAQKPEETQAGNTGASGASGDTGERSDERENILKEIAKFEAQLANAEPGSQRALELKTQVDIAKTTINGIDFATGNAPTYPNAFADDDIAIKINDDEGINTGVPWFDKWATKSLEKANSNPELLLYKLQSNGYKFAWLLIPISIPFVWLVTIGTRSHRFYDHAVFTTYSLAFMSLLFIICALAMKFNIAPALITRLAMLYVPFHIYRQLRHAYGLSRLSAIMRFALLSIFIVIALLLFFITLLALGLLSS